MTWSIHHVSLLAHDLDAAAHFFGTLIGLGAARAPDEQSRFIGEAGRGLRLHRRGAGAIWCCFARPDWRAVCGA